MKIAHAPQDGQKTIFVVDDDPAVLKSVSALLLESKYKVLEAGSGAEAIQLSGSYKGTIDLLLSDFQMVGMSGVELATKLTANRPQLKVLLMSGFSDGMLVLNEGWHFLAKPFISSQLRSLIVGLVSPGTSGQFGSPATTSPKPSAGSGNAPASQAVQTEKRINRR